MPFNLIKRHKAIFLVCYISFLQLVLVGCDRKSKSEKNEVANVGKPNPAKVEKVEVVNAPVLPPNKPYIAPKNIVLYEVSNMRSENEEDKVFISVSESYPLSDHPDSLALPIWKIKKLKDPKYFPIEGKYKERFFNRTKFSKSDSMFIYDYADNRLLTFPLKDLKIGAFLSPYFNSDFGPLNQTDYMIGFSIDNKFLKGIKDLYFNYSLAFIGKENPFERGKMKPMAWEKIDSSSFPKVKLKSEVMKQLRTTTLGDTHKFVKDSLNYFIQDHLGNEMNSARHLLVINSKTKDVVFEEIYFEEDGIELAQLNYSKAAYNSIMQWTGNLFKAKPPVVFGFTSLSFSCPRISFLHKSEKDIYIRCDNRH